MKKLFALLAGCLLVGACATSTPEGRIAENPAKFEGLSGKHKALVREGKIDRGMNRDGVLLAWGTPSSRFDGLQNSRRTERWDYTGSRPVYASTFGGGFGGGFYDYWGYGYSRRYSPYGYRYAVGPELVYVPYTRASVTFISGRVDSWERLK